MIFRFVFAKLGLPCPFLLDITIAAIRVVANEAPLFWENPGKKQGFTAQLRHAHAARAAAHADGGSAAARA